MEIIAYEMQMNKSIIDTPSISCIPFQKQYFCEYMEIYNECFYEMRKALDIEPYNFLYDYEQIVDKTEEPITLHVAAWNQKAIMLYEKCGFEIVKVEKVR